MQQTHRALMLTENPLSFLPVCTPQCSSVKGHLKFRKSLAVGSNSSSSTDVIRQNVWSALAKAIIQSGISSKRPSRWSLSSAALVNKILQGKLEVMKKKISLTFSSRSMKCISMSPLFTEILASWNMLLDENGKKTSPKQSTLTAPAS